MRHGSKYKGVHWSGPQVYRKTQLITGAKDIFRQVEWQYFPVRKSIWEGEEDIFCLTGPHLPYRVFC